MRSIDAGMVWMSCEKGCDWLFYVLSILVAIAKTPSGVRLLCQDYHTSPVRADGGIVDGAEAGRVFNKSWAGMHLLVRLLQLGKARSSATVADFGCAPAIECGRTSNASAATVWKERGARVLTVSSRCNFRSG